MVVYVESLNVNQVHVRSLENIVRSLDIILVYVRSLKTVHDPLTLF